MQQFQIATRIFHTYRLSLSALLLGSVLLIPMSFYGDIENPGLLRTMLLVWFIATTATSLGSSLIKESAEMDTANLMIDMLMLSALGWATGGLDSGLFFLMLPSAALAGILLPWQYALFIASIATIGTFTAQMFLIFRLDLSPAVYFPTGILGALLFVCTLVFKALERQLRKREKHAEQAELRAEALDEINRQIIEKMQIGVLGFDSDMTIHLANGPARTMLCSGEDAELIGLNLSDVPSLYKAFRTWKKNPQKAMQPVTLASSGMVVNLGFSHFELAESQQTLIWIEDERENQQRAHYLKIEALSKLSGSLAHEIRNPLSAIQQANELLSDSEHLTEADQELTTIIDRHCTRMNDIIDIVQQMARRIDPKPELINIVLFLEHFIREYRETVNEKFDINVSIGEPIEALFDPKHLKQVLTNLFNNAREHGGNDSEHAQIKVSCALVPEKRVMHLDIQDNGFGIPRQACNKVFDAFYSTSSRGSGLGLYLVRQLCEANFASVSYSYQNEQQSSGFFRISIWQFAPGHHKNDKAV